jgi:hypothetical protein
VIALVVMPMIIVIWLAIRVALLTEDRDRWRKRAERNTKVLQNAGLTVLPEPPASMLRPMLPPPRPADSVSSVTPKRGHEAGIKRATTALMAAEAEDRIRDTYGMVVSRSTAQAHAEAVIAAYLGKD